MEKYTLHLIDNKITIQEADYIEDGWYIEIVGKEVILYEIPLFGGQEVMVGSYETILHAINRGKELT